MAVADESNPGHTGFVAGSIVFFRAILHGQSCTLAASIDASGPHERRRIESQVHLYGVCVGLPLFISSKIIQVFQPEV